MTGKQPFVGIGKTHAVEQFLFRQRSGFTEIRQQSVFYFHLTNDKYLAFTAACAIAHTQPRATQRSIALHVHARLPGGGEMHFHIAKSDFDDRTQPKFGFTVADPTLAGNKMRRCNSHPRHFANSKFMPLNKAFTLALIVSLSLPRPMAIAPSG